MELQELETQLASCNIIVVDDEPIARKVLVKGLSKCGYKSKNHILLQHNNLLIFFNDIKRYHKCF